MHFCFATLIQHTSNDIIGFYFPFGGSSVPPKMKPQIQLRAENIGKKELTARPGSLQIKFRVSLQAFTVLHHWIRTYSQYIH